MFNYLVPGAICPSSAMSKTNVPPGVKALYVRWKSDRYLDQIGSLTYILHQATRSRGYTRLYLPPQVEKPWFCVSPRRRTSFV
ncbi:hypothetical protein [Nostoc sp. UHCC 0252]|uniref:hypothetical protein n=1 Tax=Nostoc sp. UHCC 0252 TaxID=3110241 RepID=UPI002B20AEF4|nr:hypothetical protein [Nostoc sp. UHCC 0252]MEA5603426.1 hypothetical protein [Nostoc sp. UHCC 0252]